jgi:regulator of protease activity HflC (stomatin/prohibitin superfamily)
MKPFTHFAFVAAVLALASGCYGAVVEPGHRGLMFDPRHGGLQHEILTPGYHSLDSCFLRTVCSRIDDFDVTYTTSKETIDATTKEGLPATVHVAVIHRPIVSELYELDTEIGRDYYAEVVGPEFRSVARLVFARHSAVELSHGTEKLEDDMEATLRTRLKGTHVEVSAITVESFKYPPKVEAIVTQMLIEQATKPKDTANTVNTAIK